MALVSAAVVSLLLSVSPLADAQPIGMPQPALLPSASPRCDSNLVPCLDIDDFAAHAYAHRMVLPQTEPRGVAEVIPYGVALGLLGRFSGSVSTSYALWSQNETLRHGHSLCGSARQAARIARAGQPTPLADRQSYVLPTPPPATTVVCCAACIPRIFPDRLTLTQPTRGSRFGVTGDGDDPLCSDLCNILIGGPHGSGKAGPLARRIVNRPL